MRKIMLLIFVVGLTGCASTPKPAEEPMASAPKGHFRNKKGARYSQTECKQMGHVRNQDDCLSRGREVWLLVTAHAATTMAERTWPPLASLNPSPLRVRGPGGLI